MRLEHHLVGGYVRYISPYIIIICITKSMTKVHFYSHCQILGRVVLGPNSQGEELAHWNDMISSSKPVARWHRLIT